MFDGNLVITTTDGVDMADVLFGGPAATRAGLNAAQAALRKAHDDLSAAQALTPSDDPFERWYRDPALIRETIARACGRVRHCEREVERFCDRLRLLDGGEVQEAAA